ncbi:MAG TPA: hypothetical protein ENI31_06120 [Candidatus Omnitrophica bacterium]|nr:MAG: hypothetical protein DRP80_05015 [Candidatus Omnitrophota bacterium]HEC69839.1 hypothetical protein [Candidatus Omnitrophota bacterium]
MKKVLFLVGVLLFSSLNLLFGQHLEIVDLEGKVLVRKVPLTWQSAKLGMFLDKDYELKTYSNSSCILAFDSELENVIKISENSQVKIESLFPSRVFISQGRIFSLIKDLRQAQSFKVRTPVAVAGARGTGWISSFGGSAEFLCLEDSIHIQGFDPQGNLTGEEDVDEGFGIEVDEDGELGDIFKLTSEDYQDWQGFKEDLGEIVEERGEEETVGEKEGEDSEESLEYMENLRDEDLEDVRRETQEDQSQVFQEEKRAEEEQRDTTISGEGGQDEGGTLQTQ